MSPSADILAPDRAALARLDGKTFLITGGEGMLGRAFSNQLARHVPTARVHALGRQQLDVREPAAFHALGDLRPDYVVHCAALVDADYCEDHEDAARVPIVTGTLNAAEFARRCGAKLLYPQSFLIYDGADVPIDETSAPRPLCVYGRLKLEAECVALQHADTTVAVRMAGFFGGESADDNFVGRITPHLAKLIHQGTDSIDIGDRVWQPTYTHDLAANSLLLLAHDAAGVYCMASHGSASFQELTLEIVRQLDVSDRLRVGRVDAALLAAKEKARRPLSAVMRNSRLAAEGLDRQRTWQLSLAEYLNQPYFRDMFR